MRIYGPRGKEFTGRCWIETQCWVSYFLCLDSAVIEISTTFSKLTQWNHRIFPIQWKLGYLHLTFIGCVYLRNVSPNITPWNKAHHLSSILLKFTVAMRWHKKKKCSWIPVYSEGWRKEKSQVIEARAQLTKISWCPFFICLLRWGPNLVTLHKILWTCHTPHIEPLLLSHQDVP
jgi:hypothetical protein